MGSTKETGFVRKIIRFSAVDGPGNRAAIFLQGCNYNCVFCHNPETIAMQSAQAAEMTPARVFQELGSAVHFIRGITVSGGECTLQPAFVAGLFRLAKEKGFSTMIDSNGSYDFSRNPALMAVTDGVMLDVKSMDCEEHKKLTAAGNEMVLKNMDFLAKSNRLYEIRTVCSPTMLDCEKTVDQASRFIASYGAVKYKLIKYRPKGVRKEYLASYKAPDNGFMEKLRAIAAKNGVQEIIVI